MTPEKKMQALVEKYSENYVWQIDCHLLKLGKELMIPEQAMNDFLSRYREKYVWQVDKFLMGLLEKREMPTGDLNREMFHLATQLLGKLQEAFNKESAELIQGETYHLAKAIANNNAQNFFHKDLKLTKLAELVNYAAELAYSLDYLTRERHIS